VATSLLAIALSVGCRRWMSASSFADSITLTRNVAALALVPFRSSLIASRKMSASVSASSSNVTFSPVSTTPNFFCRDSEIFVNPSLKRDPRLLPF